MFGTLEDETEIKEKLVERSLDKQKVMGLCFELVARRAIEADVSALCSEKYMEAFISTNEIYKELTRVLDDQTMGLALKYSLVYANRRRAKREFLTERTKENEAVLEEAIRLDEIAADELTAAIDRLEAA